MRIKLPQLWGVFVPWIYGSLSTRPPRPRTAEPARVVFPVRPTLSRSGSQPWRPRPRLRSSARRHPPCVSALSSPEEIGGAGLAVSSHGVTLRYCPAPPTLTGTGVSRARSRIQIPTPTMRRLMSVGPGFGELAFARNTSSGGIRSPSVEGLLERAGQWESGRARCRPPSNSAFTQAARCGPNAASVAGTLDPGRATDRGITDKVPYVLRLETNFGAAVHHRRVRLWIRLSCAGSRVGQPLVRSCLVEHSGHRALAHQSAPANARAAAILVSCNRDGER